MSGLVKYRQPNIVTREKSTAPAIGNGIIDMRHRNMPVAAITANTKRAILSFSKRIRIPHTKSEHTIIPHPKINLAKLL
jgi:hypothetical protein